MEAVTGQDDVLEIAKELVRICDGHTNSAILARGAIQIADVVIASRQSCEALALSAEVPEQSPPAPER